MGKSFNLSHINVKRTCRSNFCLKTKCCTCNLFWLEESHIGKTPFLFLIGSCLIRQKEERCLSNVGLFKPKKITSATLGIEAKIAPTESKRKLYYCAKLKTLQLNWHLVIFLTKKSHAPTIQKKNGESVLYTFFNMLPKYYPQVILAILQWVRTLKFLHQFSPSPCYIFACS